jgi:hypothetical protein
VNAQLIDAQTGGHLWAERFDLKRSDIQQLQDDIVGLLSRAIDLKMIDAQARRSDRERPNVGLPAPAVLVRPRAEAIRRPEPGSEVGAGPKMIQPEGACARDAERLAGLRADPTVDAITRFERELGCEQLRPQLRLRRESVGQ